jgi:D-lyxose ketol-isomerase
MWADWSPEQFDSTTVGIRDQKLGWKVVDFGLGDFQHCGLVLFVLCNPLTDDVGENIRRLASHANICLFRQDKQNRITFIARRR